MSEDVLARLKDVYANYRTRPCETSELKAVLKDTINEIEWLKRELHSRINEGVASIHLIAKADIVPGISISCRCIQCRGIAVSMDQCGYLDHVKDRWWEREIGDEHGT